MCVTYVICCFALRFRTIPQDYIHIYIHTYLTTREDGSTRSTTTAFQGGSLPGHPLRGPNRCRGQPSRCESCNNQPRASDHCEREPRRPANVLRTQICTLLFLCKDASLAHTLERLSKARLLHISRGGSASAEKEWRWKEIYHRYLHMLLPRASRLIVFAPSLRTNRALKQSVHGCVCVQTKTALDYLL